MEAKVAVHWSRREKLSPLLRDRFLPLSIVPSVPLCFSASSRCRLSLLRKRRLLSLFIFLFHSGHVSLLRDRFLSFPGSRFQCLSFSLLCLDRSFLHGWRCRCLSVEHLSCLLTLPLRHERLTQCVRLRVTVAMRFVQASQNAPLVTRQGDAHPLQLIRREVATLLHCCQAGVSKCLRVLLQTQYR